MFKLKLFLPLMGILLLGGSTFSFANNLNPDVDQIKRDMIRSIESASVTDSLYLKLKQRNSSDPLIKAYIGTLEALKAKHAWNPYNKVKYVSLSSKTMKEAVAKAPHDMEIRFMRFSIQHYTPVFLGFSKDLDEDRRMIFQQFRARKFGIADKQLVQSIAAFMIQSGRCTSEEEAVFKKYA